MTFLHPSRPEADCPSPIADAASQYHLSSSGSFIVQLQIWIWLWLAIKLQLRCSLANHSSGHFSSSKLPRSRVNGCAIGFGILVGDTSRRDIIYHNRQIKVADCHQYRGDVVRFLSSGDSFWDTGKEKI
ncbi:uncharacterized protein LOC122005664 isoform X2 [Zingiber officinale]|uniref:uncharacterized protein LOC122005664 isoform X2 n=1 Tax=Zingiber officinale TaxID=94328 RepID=UPI001C4B710C|nr:uncharacterized protein LOC122005664 isoform X2 [Zingiber officinale]